MDSTLKKSLEFAIKAHSGQKRLSTEEFINHPIRVKNYLKEVQINDETILSAAILHDILKSTPYTAKELEDLFGEDIAYLITKLNEVSNIKLPRNEILTKDTQNLHKLIIKLSEDIRVLIIRLADRIDNIKTCGSLPLKDQRWIAKKALNIYAPIAESVGVHNYFRHFTRESFRILNPKRYYKIREHIDKRIENAEPTLKALEERLSHLVNTITNDYKITSRRKSIYSIHLKALHKAEKGDIRHIEDIENLFDLLGIRILVNTEQECFEIMDKIRKNWKEVEGEYDDYITNPKSNGYKTLQTSIRIDNTLTCEIQVRTYEMHNFNEYGNASHYLYKYGSKKDRETEWMRKLIEKKDNLINKITADSKLDLFENEIIVLTPKQDVISLPKGSTALDFAYAIHTDLGNTCDNLYVNKKLVKFDHELKSGDVVEVKTRKNRKPKKDWINYVKTSEAKRNIRKYATN